MAMRIMEPNSDFSHIRIRANSQALENKRRNETVNEILRPPPQPFAGEDPPPVSVYGNSEPKHDLDSDDVRKVRKASNPFGSETAEAKAARQQREAEDDIRRYKDERQRDLLERRLEKQRDLQMLQAYDPWGRPGHGAPLGPEQESQRKRKFLTGGEAQEATPDDAETEQGLSLNRPGHGAPLRSDSGRLVTQLPGDPALRFRARDGAPDKRGRDPADTLRYKNPDGQSYARELDLHMQQQMQQREMERAYELQEELNTLQYDPYGKPGSGAPNLQQRQADQLQQPHQRRQDQAAQLVAERWDPEHRQAAGQFASSQPPWAPTAGPKDAGAQWYQRRDPMETQSAPNMPRSPSLPPVQHRGGGNAEGHSDGAGGPGAYNPFGRPGAGAPLRAPDGRRVPSVFGATEKFEESPGEKHRRAEAAKIYSQELERGLIEQSLNRKLEIQQRRAPVESPIADQLARGSVGKPSRDPRTGVLLDQRLSSSDVTHVNYKTPRHKFRSETGYQHLPEFIQTAEGYSSELERAAVERAAARRLDRAREIHEADRHAQAFDRMFGRPGAGAPGPFGARKVNLDRALHNPDGMRNEFLKPVDHMTQVRSTAYVRNPTGSTHDNGYEIPSDGHSAIQPHYSLMAPYAIQRQG